MVALPKYALGILAAAVLVALVGATPPVLVASNAAAATQIALNPQPLPPHEDGDTDFDFDFG
jgi:hypothetical protein